MCPTAIRVDAARCRPPVIYRHGSSEVEGLPSQNSACDPGRHLLRIQAPKNEVSLELLADQNCFALAGWQNCFKLAVKTRAEVCSWQNPAEHLTALLVGGFSTSTACCLGHNTSRHDLICQMFLSLPEGCKTRLEPKKSSAKTAKQGFAVFCQAKVKTPSILVLPTTLIETSEMESSNSRITWATLSQCLSTSAVERRRISCRA